MKKIISIKRKNQIVQAEACDEKKADERINSIKNSIVKHSLPVLYIEATSRCNLKCVFCAMHSNQLYNNTKEKRHMDMDLFNEVIEKSKGMNTFKVLYLQGNGESLLNPNIVEMVNIANIAEQIVLVTNGTLLTSDKFRKLAKAGISSIRVSLDVISPDKFRNIKGVDVGQRVIKNVEACIELIRAEDLNTKLVILCADIDDKELGGETKKIINHFEPLIQDSPNITIHLRRMFNWVDSINRLSDKIDNEFNRPVPCEQPFYLLMVHYDGDISACCADTQKKWY